MHHLLMVLQPLSNDGGGGGGGGSPPTSCVLQKLLDHEVFERCRHQHFSLFDMQYLQDDKLDQIEIMFEPSKWFSTVTIVMVNCFVCRKFQRSNHSVHSTTREIFYRRTCIATENMVSIQVLMETFSLVVL